MAGNRPVTLIVGATSGIAEACARLWAIDGGHDYVLVGRRKEALESIATDLRARDSAATVTVMTLDVTDAAAIDACVDEISSAGAARNVLVAFGVLPDQDVMQSDSSALAAALDVNAVAPALWAEACVRAAGSGPCTIGVIGSVAGDRGRKSNYAYGAAKGLVDRFMEGLQHRCAGSEIHPVLIKPGPTQTAMTAHLETAKLAPVEDVARDIVTGMAAGKTVIYTPGKWRLIMAVIRNLPRVVFNRMDI